MNIHMKVKNFGPIEKAEIDLRPLTVFMGESNTGKTYLAALIYALHKNFGGISQFPWVSSAAFYFRLFYRSRHRYAQSRQEEIEQEVLTVLEKLNTPGRTFRFSDLPQELFDRSKSILTDQKDFPNELIRCFDLEAVSKLIRFTGNQNNEMKVSLSVHDRNQTCWSFETRDAGSGPTVEGHINPDTILFNAKRSTELYEMSDVERLFSDFRYPPAANREFILLARRSERHHAKPQCNCKFPHQTIGS